MKGTGEAREEEDDLSPSALHEGTTNDAQDGWLEGLVCPSGLCPFRRYIARSCPFCAHLPVCPACFVPGLPRSAHCASRADPTLAPRACTLPLSDSSVARYRKVDRAPCSVSYRPAYPITYRPRARPSYGMSPPLVTLGSRGETSGTYKRGALRSLKARQDGDEGGLERSVASKKEGGGGRSVGKKHEGEEGGRRARW